MWHKQSFTQFWSQSDAYSRRSSLKLTYIHHPLVVCTHQICCAVAVPIALSQDRLLHGHNRLVNWTPCSRMREQAKKPFNSYLTAPCAAWFNFDYTNPDDNEKIIQNLRPKSSSGYDNISTKLLKEIEHVILRPLSIIVNQSLCTGIFPEKLKIAKVQERR